MPDHLMQLIHTDSFGVEHWHCPECGREFLLRWPPDYYKQTLVEGDTTVRHRGEKIAVQPGEAGCTDDPHLDVFARFLKDKVQY